MSSRADTSATGEPAAETSAGTAATPVGPAVGFRPNGLEADCRSLAVAERLP